MVEHPVRVADEGGELNERKHQRNQCKWRKA
jgi:hypothetical protein